MSIKNILQTFATESSYFQENYKEVSLSEYPELGIEYSLLLEGIESFDTVSELSNSETCQITNMEMSPLTSLIVFTEYFQHIVAVESIMDEKGCTMGEAFVALESYGLESIKSIHSAGAKISTFLRNFLSGLMKVEIALEYVFTNGFYILNSSLRQLMVQYDTILKNKEKNKKAIKNSKYVYYLDFDFENICKDYLNISDMNKVNNLNSDIKSAKSLEELKSKTIKNLISILSNDITGKISESDLSSTQAIKEFIKKYQKEDLLVEYFTKKMFKEAKFESVNSDEFEEKFLKNSKMIISMLKPKMDEIKKMKKEMRKASKEYAIMDIAMSANMELKDVSESVDYLKAITSLITIYAKKHKKCSIIVGLILYQYTYNATPKMKTIASIKTVAKTFSMQITKALGIKSNLEISILEKANS